MKECLESLSRDQLNDALIRLNVLRTMNPPDPMVLDLLEGAVEAMFSVSRKLIVYGSLAPGGPNHGLVSGLEGEWQKGCRRNLGCPRHRMPDAPGALLQRRLGVPNLGYAR